MYGIIGFTLFASYVIWGRPVYGLTNTGAKFAKFGAILWMVLYPIATFFYLVNYNGGWVVIHVLWIVIATIALNFLISELRRKPINLIDIPSRTNSAMIFFPATLLMFIFMLMLSVG